MQNNDNKYWYKERSSSKRRAVYRLSFPVIALLALIFWGIQPVFSESNNSVEFDGSNTADTKTETSTNLSGSIEGNSIYDNQNSSSDKQNSASISGSEVSVQIDDSSKASIGQSDSSISISIKNSDTLQTETPADNSTSPTLVINGEEVKIPENGRVVQVLRDDSSTTRLRTDIDSNGSSSIRIDSSSN